MGGDLASGKSEYSRRIAAEFGISVINKDILKEILGDKFIAGSREENLRLSAAAFDIICYIIKSSASDLIIESNFKEEEMQVLSRLAGECEYTVLSLRFTGKDDILHERFLHRLKDNRHYVHKSQDFTDLNDFLQTLLSLRAVKYIGKVIEVDSTDFSYASDENLEKEIRRFLSCALH